jgi:molybdopterin-binding protein
MRLSARNQLTGKVTAAKFGDVMAEITVEIDAGAIVSAITTASAQSLDIKPGDTVTVVIKSTEVMIAKDS